MAFALGNIEFIPYFSDRLYMLKQLYKYYTIQILPRLDCRFRLNFYKWVYISECILADSTCMVYVYAGQREDHINHVFDKLYRFVLSEFGSNWKQRNKSFSLKISNPTCIESIRSRKNFYSKHQQIPYAEPDNKFINLSTRYQPHFPRGRLVNSHTCYKRQYQ